MMHGHKTIKKHTKDKSRYLHADLCNSRSGFMIYILNALLYCVQYVRHIKALRGKYVMLQLMKTWV
jgi:hypothetical protein